MNFTKFILVFAVVIAIIMVLPACKLFEDEKPKLENHATIIDMVPRYEAQRDGAMLYIKNITAKWVNDSSESVTGSLKIDWVSGISPHGRYEDDGIRLPPTNGEEVEGFIDQWGDVERHAYFKFTGEKTETILFEVVFMGKTTFYSRTVTMRSL